MFGAALLLVGFVGRELWRRLAPAPGAPPAPSAASFENSVPDVAVIPTRPPLPGQGRTETAVSGVPSIKLSGVSRRKAKSAPVPAPK